MKPRARAAIVLSLTMAVVLALLSTAVRSDAKSSSPFTVTLRDIVFEPDVLMVPANESVTISLPNQGVATHTFNIDALTIHSGPVSAGAIGSVTFTAKPGTYTYYCSEPNHRAAGMEGTLIVAERPNQNSSPQTTPALPGDAIADLQARVSVLETQVSTTHP